MTGMNEANYFIFFCLSSKKIQSSSSSIWCYIFKVPQGDDKWKYKWKKNTEVESPKNNTFVYEIHYSKYQLIKSIYKIITSMFQQKSLEAYHNSGIQSN